MRHYETDLLILGLGNVLLSDDGLGIAAVSRLERGYRIPEGVKVVDGGTLGLSLLPLLEGARQALLVDAVATDDAPGTLVRLTGADVAPAVHHRLSPHQVGVADLLDGARLRDRLPERVVLLGIVPQWMELGISRSPAVEAALPDLVAAVVAEAWTMSWQLPPWSGGEPVPAGSFGALADLFGL